MSFKSYATSIQPDGSLLLDDPQPLVFSGKHGLIARYVLGAGSRAEGPWRLCPGELHALATPRLQLRNRTILFEQADHDTLELLALEAIHGVSAERTEMMFRFRPLRLLSHAPVLHVTDADGGIVYTEELALEGGVSAPAGSWHWRKPHLAIGGVVCGARTAASSPRNGQPHAVT